MIYLGMLDDGSSRRQRDALGWKSDTVLSIKRMTPRSSGASHESGPSDRNIQTRHRSVEFGTNPAAPFVMAGERVVSTGGLVNCRTPILIRVYGVCSGRPLSSSGRLHTLQIGKGS